MTDFADALRELRVALRPFFALLELEQTLNAATEAQQMLANLDHTKATLEQQIAAKQTELAAAAEHLRTARERTTAEITARELEHADTLARLRDEHARVMDQHTTDRAAAEMETVRVLKQHEEARSAADTAAREAEGRWADARSRLASLRKQIE